MQNDVLLGILFTLVNEKKCTAKQLAAKYELSVRTVYRYLDTLNQAGVPLVSFTGSGGGVAIADNFRVDKTFFTKAEYDKIISALEAFEISSGGKDQVLEEKLKALSMSDSPQYVLQSENLFIDAPSADGIKNKMAAFGDAIYNNKVCRIIYHSRKGEITDRKILPHAFTFQNGQWYVYAYCQSRKDFRLFKISRVFSVFVTDETFERLPLPPRRQEEDEYTSLPRVRLSLMVEEKCRPDVEEWLGIENVRKSGDKFYASAVQVLDRQLISKLMSFGDGIKIISPTEVRDEVKKTLKEALAAYEETKSP